MTHLTSTAFRLSPCAARQHKPRRMRAAVLGSAALVLLATSGCTGIATTSPEISPAPGAAAETSSAAPDSAVVLGALHRDELLGRVATEQSCPSGSLTLTDAPEGEVIRVTGSCDITVTRRGTVLVADDIGTLTVTAHDVLISAVSLNTAHISGDGVTLGWESDGQPSITDTGEGNVLGRISA